MATIFSTKYNPSSKKLQYGVTISNFNTEHFHIVYISMCSNPWNNGIVSGDDKIITEHFPGFSDLVKFHCWDLTENKPYAWDQFTSYWQHDVARFKPDFRVFYANCYVNAVHLRRIACFGQKEPSDIPICEMLLSPWMENRLRMLREEFKTKVVDKGLLVPYK